MNETIPYYGDLHIDEGTKKLILNLLNGIRSVVPVASPPEPGRLQNESEQKELDRIRNVLVLANQHPEELDGLFNPDELLRYANYVLDYQEIMDQLEKTLKEVKVCRDSAMQFASGMAEIVEGHIMMCASPGVGCEQRIQKESIHIDGERIKLKVV